MQVLYLGPRAEVGVTDSVLATLKKVGLVVHTNAFSDVYELLAWQEKKSMYAFTVCVVHESLLTGLTEVRSLTRVAPNVPLIVISFHSIQRSVEYLTAGASFYFSLTEDRESIALRSLVLSAGRRAHGVSQNIVTFGNLELSLNERIVRVAGQSTRFLDGEYRLLEELICRTVSGRPLALRELLHVLYGEKSYPDSKVESVRLSRLRVKLKCADASALIEYRIGVGYHLVLR